MCLYVCIYVFTLPHHYKLDEKEIQFLCGFKLVWIQSFHSFWPVALPRLKNQSDLLFNHYLVGKKRIHAFPMSISVKWYANTLVQDLNLSCWFYFIWG